MIKQADTAGYVSISGRKIAGILLILISSFALAWATRTSVKPAQPSMPHTNQTPTVRRHVSAATHNHRVAMAQAHTNHKQGALSNFNKHIKPSSKAAHSKAAGQGAGQGAGEGADPGAGQDSEQGAGQGSKPTSDTTPSPTPEESPSAASDTTSTTMTDTPRWPRAAATPAPPLP